MSQKNFERFQQLVLQDLSLQARLREIDERSVFIREVIELSAERGCEITAEDVREAMRRNLRSWLERWI